jgi:hypothetical protein
MRVISSMTDGLAADQQGDGQHQLVGVGQHIPEVEHHADGDEEQAEQDVAEGPDVGFDVVAIHRLGNQHAADEGAQRQRQAALRGEEGQADHDPQRGQHQHLVGADGFAAAS